MSMRSALDKQMRLQFAPKESKADVMSEFSYIFSSSLAISRRKHSVSVLSACLFACPCAIIY